MCSDILSIDIGKSYITLSNKEKEQVARLFFSRSTDKINENNDIGNVFIYPYICIMRLYIDSRYRNKKWATFVMNKFFELCKEFKSFTVTANPDDESSISRDDLKKFYEKFGFVDFKEIDEGTIMIKNEKTR